MKSADDLQDEIAELREILSRIIMDGQVPEYVGRSRWEWMNVTTLEAQPEPLDRLVHPTHAAVLQRACETRF